MVITAKRGAADLCRAHDPPSHPGCTECNPVQPTRTSGQPQPPSTAPSAPGGPRISPGSDGWDGIRIQPYAPGMPTTRRSLEREIARYNGLEVADLCACHPDARRAPIDDTLIPTAWRFLRNLLALHVLLRQGASQLLVSSSLSSTHRVRVQTSRHFGGRSPSFATASTRHGIRRI